MTYIDKIKSAMALKSLSCRQLSFESDLADRTIRKILSGESEPLVTSIEKLCLALDIPIAELFCRDNERIYNVDSENAHILRIFNAISKETKDILLCLAAKLKGR